MCSTSNVLLSYNFRPLLGPHSIFLNSRTTVFSLKMDVDSLRFYHEILVSNEAFVIRRLFIFEFVPFFIDSIANQYTREKL